MNNEKYLLKISLNKAINGKCFLRSTSSEFFLDNSSSIIIPHEDEYEIEFAIEEKIYTKVNFSPLLKFLNHKHIFDV